jgi:SAM-dependent methyltransferase
MEKREEILDLLEKSHAAMMTQLDEVDRQRKIYPLWTIREIIAHLSGWDDAMLGFINALLKGETPPIPAPRGAEVYNEETVSTREGLSYDHIVREYVDTRSKLLNLMRQIPEEMVTQKSVLPWGAEGTLEEIVQIFGPHEMEHAMDVKKIITNGNIPSFNREAWNREVESGKNPWTVPVSPEVIAQARSGDWAVLLTENKPVPRDWFPPMPGLELLGLACGGGQQGPIFAAAGADVTIFDNSPAQLARDREVAEREGLSIRTVEGDMRDLSAFADESFDFIFHPVSNLFIHEIRPVWKEAYRVLRHGGTMLAGFMNPVFYIFDWEDMDKGILTARHKIPFSDVETYGLERLRKEDRPAEFGHSLTDQIAGQLDAGFAIVSMYEDRHNQFKLSELTSTYIATRAVKP